MMLILVLSTGIVYSSCSKDSKEENEPKEQPTLNPLSGTKWSSKDGDYLHFKTQNTGIFYEGKQEENFTYLFNPNDNTILMLFGDEYESALYAPRIITWGSQKFYRE